VTVGDTETPFPLVTTPTPWSTLPFPLLNVGVRVVEFPETIVSEVAVKLVMIGAGTTVTVAVIVTVAGVVAALVTVNVYVVVDAGETVTGVPLVTAPTLLLTLPVPPLNTAVNVVELPAVIVCEAAVKLVIAGAATTFSVKVCCALGFTPLLAVIVIGVLPTAAAIPEIVAVPLPLSVKFTLAGSDPVLLNAGVGLPVVVTVNVPLVPAVNVTEVALVMAGAWTRTTLIVNV
jgi:hypothetical protein